MFGGRVNKRAKERLAGITFRWWRLELSDLRLVLPLILAVMVFGFFALMVRIDWPSDRVNLPEDMRVWSLSGSLEPQLASLLEKAESRQRSLPKLPAEVDFLTENELSDEILAKPMPVMTEKFGEISFELPDLPIIEPPQPILFPAGRVYLPELQGESVAMNLPKLSAEAPQPIPVLKELDGWRQPAWKSFAEPVPAQLSGSRWRAHIGVGQDGQIVLLTWLSVGKDEDFVAIVNEWLQGHRFERIEGEKSAREGEATLGRLSFGILAIDWLPPSEARQNSKSVEEDD